MGRDGGQRSVLARGALGSYGDAQWRAWPMNDVAGDPAAFAAKSVYNLLVERLRDDQGVPVWQGWKM